MPVYTDSLRGYAYQIHKRDNFTCRYCGLDGRLSFGNWLSLSLDHLLPKGHPNRDNPAYTVTACLFCNTADNRYFDFAEQRGLAFDDKTPDELVAQRLPYVTATRDKYREFWLENVQTNTHLTQSEINTDEISEERCANSPTELTPG